MENRSINYKLNTAIFEHLAKGGSVFIEELGALSSQICIVNKSDNQSKTIKKAIVLSSKKTGKEIKEFVAELALPGVDSDLIVSQWYKSTMLENSHKAIKFVIESVVTINVDRVKLTAEIIPAKKLQNYLNPAFAGSSNELIDNSAKTEQKKTFNDILREQQTGQEQAVGTPSGEVIPIDIIAEKPLNAPLAPVIGIKTVNDTVIDRKTGDQLRKSEEEEVSDMINKPNKGKKKNVTLIIIVCLLTIALLVILIYTGVIKLNVRDKYVTKPIAAIEAVEFPRTVEQTEITDIAEVALESKVVSKKAKTSKYSPARNKHYLVVGGFKVANGAKKRAVAVEELGYTAYIVKPKNLSLVMVPIGDKNELTASETRLKNIYKGSWVYLYK